MVNIIMWEKLTEIEICEYFWWIIEILCLGYPSPIEKSRKMEECQIICFDESWK